MELSADEFVERIRKGEPVSGARIRGQVTIARGTQVLQQDWSDCRFDSSIEIQQCVLPADKNTGRAVLDMSEARIDGRIHFDSPQTSAAPIGDEEIVLLLSGAGVVGEMVVRAPKSGPKISVNFSRASFSGQVWLRGKFKRIDGQDSKIGARLGVHLTPLASVPQIVDERQGDGDIDALVHIPSVRIDVSRSYVSGDVEIVPDEEFVHLAQESTYHDDEEHLPDLNILFLLDAGRIKVGGDLFAGIPQSDYSPAAGWQELLTNGVNLRRAEVLGEVVLRHVRVIRTEPLEEDSHLRVGVAARKLRCGSLSLKRLAFEIELHEESGISPGEFVRLVELDDAKVQGKVSLWLVTGSVQTKPETWAGPNVDGISIARMECESLALSRSAPVYVDAGSVAVLPIEADGIKVLGSAGIDLREKIDHWSSGFYGQEVVDRIIASVGPEIIPDASAQGATIGHLELVADPPVREKVDLTGGQVKRWKIGSGGQEEETAASYLALLRATKGLDVGLYLAVEKRLEDIGKRREADAVHVAWQRRRRRERLFSQSKPRWLLSWLHDAALGYGTKTWRPAFVIVAAFVVSSFLVFTYHGQWVQVSAQTYGELAACGVSCADRLNAMLAEGTASQRALDAIALSAKNLIPVIDLQVARDLEAIPGTNGGYWLLLLRLIGIVAWPVLLAGSLAQVIHKRNLAG